jgi:N-acetylglucosamine-6-sulfatase
MRRFAAFLLFLLFAAPVSARPNFIVILTDDQEDTGSMAYMPKVQSLIAQEGIRFTNSFVSFPECCPSRVSFLTGQYAHNHGVESNSPARKGGWQAFKDRENNTLPEWLKAAGYETAFVGKYLNAYASGSEVGAPPTWVPPGWDLWFAFTGSPTYYDYLINKNGSLLRFGNQPSDYSTDVLKDRAVRFIKEQAVAAGPFFLLIAPKAPHEQGEAGERGPAIPSPDHQQDFADIGLPDNAAFNEEDVSDKPRWVQVAPKLSESARRELTNRYRSELQSLQSVDDLVEGVVSALGSIGKLDDTIIIFTSDNGYLYGDHRLNDKFNAYEGSIRVPLVIRGPGIPRNEVRSQLVNNLEVVATIEELAGVTPGVKADDRPLTPLFADANAPWRNAILIEGGDEGSQPSRRFKTVRTATRKYTKYDNGFEELYDLNVDPAELNNKVGDPAYAGDHAALSRIYDTLKACADSGCWVTQ